MTNRVSYPDAHGKEVGMGLTAEMGRFVGSLRYDMLPPDAAKIVRLGFTDCIACMITGWNEPVTRTAARGLGIIHDGPNTPISALEAPAPERALILGVAAHAIDYDDTGLAGHPSAILVPTILSEAAETGADGRAMITAYVAGYELWAEATRRDADQHHRKGWHPTAMFGTIAAAGAVASLRGHDAAMATRTIGIAASLAGGIVGNFGSMTKPYQVGRAAQSGLLAARLAEVGLTSTATAIEDDLGFLRAISPKGNVDTTTPARFGQEWGILRAGINIKLYPVCYAVHRALDALIDLRKTRPVKADEIEAIDLEIGETQAEILRVHRPTNGLDAKISGEFAMASAIVAGACGNAELTDAFVNRPEVQDLIRKVRIVTTAERDDHEPAHSPFDRVTLHLRGGEALTSEAVKRPRGHFQRGVETEAMWAKFADCVKPTLGEAGTRALFEAIQELDRMTSIADFGLFPRPQAGSANAKASAA
jgi:2-methylcitrate dehydratase PrpD